METILIATDFSAAARNATRYGFELAKTINAKVILFTAYKPSSVQPDNSHFPSNELEKKSYEQLVVEAEACDPFGRVALETQARPSPVTDSILTVAAENNASFIVVGMKGRGKEVRKVFGSTVTFLKKQSSIPLIVVPEETGFSIPKRIALASDINHSTDIFILQPLKKIAETFSSKLFVVRVIKKSMNEALERLKRSARLAWFLTSLQPAYELEKGENVAKGLKRFVRHHAVDLVAVIPHEHTLVERLFSRSVTNDMVFHTHVPLLILPSHAARRIVERSL